MDYKSFFKGLTGFDPYPYQQRSAVALLGRRFAIDAGLSDELSCLETESKERLSDNGRNILLCAPTGSGKTWAVAAPFIFSRKLGIPVSDRILYVLPMRSIADGLYQSTRDTLEGAGLLQLCPVRLQTGETSGIPGLGDPTLSEGRIIFCTIDQLLSSYLNIPFSLSSRQANINAGALVGSLVVLDEFHLLDPSRSLKTALLLTQHLQGLAHFVWMTATQAGRARERLLAMDRLNAVSIGVNQKELSGIPSRRGKKRKWFWDTKLLSADQVWQEHQMLSLGRKRTLVVLNTVGRAQKIYRDLKTIVPEKVPIYLLHSRFLPDHRKKKEATVRKVFGRGSHEEAILIATQVIEAGLDISGDCLHTELAPANALV